MSLLPINIGVSTTASIPILPIFPTSSNYGVLSQYGSFYSWSNAVRKSLEKARFVTALFW